MCMPQSTQETLPGWLVWMLPNLVCHADLHVTFIHVWSLYFTFYIVPLRVFCVFPAHLFFFSPSSSFSSSFSSSSSEVLSPLCGRCCIQRLYWSAWIRTSEYPGRPHQIISCWEIPVSVSFICTCTCTMYVSILAQSTHLYHRNHLCLHQRYMYQRHC